MKSKDQLLLEEAYSKHILKESNNILKNGTKVEIIQDPIHKDYSEGLDILSMVE